MTQAYFTPETHYYHQTDFLVQRNFKDLNILNKVKSKSSIYTPQKPPPHASLHPYHEAQVNSHVIPPSQPFILYELFLTKTVKTIYFCSNRTT